MIRRFEEKEPILEYVTTSAPLRVSFVGGGTDLPAFYSKGRGAVLSTAINKHQAATIMSSHLRVFGRILPNYHQHYTGTVRLSCKPVFIPYYI